MPGMVAASATAATAASLADEHAALLACQLSSWYPSLAQHALRSIVIDLSDAVVDYLGADGVFLKETSAALPLRGQADPYADEDDYRDWVDEQASSHSGSSDGNSSDDDSQHGIDYEEQCPEVAKEIGLVIQQLGGVVVPKMNWSCPFDATWLSPFNNMQCSNCDQVMLLLKSSDRVAHDLAVIQAMPAGSRPKVQLALRKWHDMRPEREFRCFVRQRLLLAISQRDPTQYFPQLQGQMSGIIASISAFMQRHVLPAFQLASYTCDVYVATTGAVKIVDFNPVGGTTSALLFDWHELYANSLASAAGTEGTDAPGVDADAAEQLSDVPSGAAGAAGEASSSGNAQHVLVRIVEDASMLQPGHRTAVAMPYDMLGLADTVDDIMRCMQQQRRQTDTS